MNKVRKAAAIKGPAFVHIFSPCATGWRMPAKNSLQAAKLAVQTKVYPLYEVINGNYVLSRKITKPKPVEAYLKLQGRFKHMTDDQIQAIQKDVDRKYAALEQFASGNAVSP
jgi:pyruvate ferredoxin oxidoreductase beta subunit